LKPTKGIVPKNILHYNWLW